MPTFRIINIEAVWERACWTVKADNVDQAREKFQTAEDTELDWKEIKGNVESIDMEIESVEEIEATPDIAQLQTACRLLVDAYSKGGPSASIDWNDLDRAYQAARTALDLPEHDDAADDSDDDQE